VILSLAATLLIACASPSPPPSADALAPDVGAPVSDSAAAGALSCKRPVDDRILVADLCQDCPGLACAGSGEICRDSFHVTGGPAQSVCTCENGRVVCCTSAGFPPEPDTRCHDAGAINGAPADARADL
jgi:hypothetical protein